jgi:tRNA isopentenyl-2-thiomethyl-A-37 hydroxylase MiaE
VLRTALRTGERLVVDAEEFEVIDDRVIILISAFISKADCEKFMQNCNFAGETLREFYTLLNMPTGGKAH